MEDYEEVELLNTSHAETLLPNASVLSTNNNDTALVENTLNIKPIKDVLLLACVLLVMLSMGVEVKKDQLLYHLKRPIGISIGMFSQFIVLPLSAFSLLQCITVSNIRATGVLLMACCPGGIFSNMFAYFCDGDLSLSVAMTSLSTLIAMGMMPLNLWMYGRKYETRSVVVPYTNLALALLTVTSPVGVGMLLRWKFPRTASISAKIGNFISPLLIVAYVVLEVIMFPSMFTSIPESLYGVMLSLPLIGFSLGYAMALLFRQSCEVRKTIAIECSIQNVPTALGIIMLSFPPEIQIKLVPIPYLYSFTMLSGSALFCCIYRVHRKCSQHRTATKNHRIKETDGETGALENKEIIVDEEDKLMLDLNRDDADAECEFLETSFDYVGRKHD